MSSTHFFFNSSRAESTFTPHPGHRSREICYNLLSMELESGSHLGNYEILEPLGAGGMGIVYRARDTKLKRDVAIKVLLDAVARDEERMKRFEREAQLLAALNHKNIATLYGLEESNGQPFLVMEFVDGETLAERMSSGALSLEQTLPIVRQIAEGLEAAHERGILHRDLKPANMKVTEAGDVKILDFGLAKALEKESPKTSDSMSPTLTRAASQMLTGARLFSGETVSDTLAAVLKTEPAWEQLRADTPLSIQKLLRRCLTKDRRERLRDIGDARLEIQDAIVELADGRADDLETPRPKTWTRRMAPFVGAVAFGLFAALGVWRLMRGDPSAPQDVRRFALTLPSGVQLQNADGVVALSPDGSHLAYVADDRVYLRAMDQLEAAPLANTERARSIVFSPDGQWIAFFAGRTLKKISIAGGSPVTLGEEVVRPRLLSWGVDDTILFDQGEPGVFRVSASGGVPERVIAVADGERAQSPWLLDDGETVLFVLDVGRGPGEAQIVAESLATGERRVLITGGSSRDTFAPAILSLVGREICSRCLSIGKGSRSQGRLYVCSMA